ncbi:MAG: RDD family protein [Acidobacteriota bacterium]|nr:RDD family protein [Acidobacteriota bacterium]
MSSDEIIIAMPNTHSSDEAETPSLNARCSAFLLDYILTLFPLSVTLVLAFFVKRKLMEPEVGGFFQYVGYALMIAVIYFNWVYSYVRFGQSFGKRFIGLRVIRADRQPLDYQTVGIRLLVYLLSMLFAGLGFLGMLWDDKQRGLHDRLAKTLVVKE